MTFYNGCPADIPWRGGNIDDIEIKKVSGSALKTRSKPKRFCLKLTYTK